MSCRKHERRISDSLDHPLSDKAARQLEVHLAACPSCRAYRARLEQMQRQALVAGTPAVPGGYWDDFSTRLGARLDRAEGERGLTVIPSRGWRWAWLAAPAAAAGIWILLQVSRPGPPSVAELASYEERPDAASQAILADAEFVDDLAAAVLASIREETGSLSAYELPALADDPGFWDGLTDDEAALIDQVIAEELKS